ncbi:MAG: radical SAM protein [Bacilli bacterium]
MIESVYIHIPFCQTRLYCDFAKLYYKKEWRDNYLDALEKEINQKYKNEKIKTIYIGGGTPSSLNLDQLKKLFNIINKFNLDQNLEFTFECNIENINEKKLIFLKKNKVNRLSIGIESFKKQILKILNQKNIDFENTKKLIDQAKTIGFENVNIDLIYSIEGQTLEDLKKDLDLFNKLNVEHISIYSLILEKIPNCILIIITMWTKT